MSRRAMPKKKPGPKPRADARTRTVTFKMRADLYRRHLECDPYERSPGQIARDIVEQWIKDEHGED